MCDTHREKDHMNRRHKSGRDNDVPGDLDEGQAGQVGEHADMVVDMGSDSDMADLEPQSPALATGSSAVLWNPYYPRTKPSQLPNHMLPTPLAVSSA